MPASSPLLEALAGLLFLIALPVAAVIAWRTIKRGHLLPPRSLVQDLRLSWQDPATVGVLAFLATAIDYRLMPVAGVVGVLTVLHLRGISATRLWGWDPKSLPASLGQAIVRYLAILPLIATVTALSYVGAQLLGYPLETQPAIQLLLSSNDLPTLLFFLVFACVIAPLWEEIFFRGFLYPWLKGIGGRPIALLLIALLFGAIHVHLPSFLPLSLFGFLLAATYERRGQLADAILLHAAFNAVTCGFILVYKYFS